MKFANGVLVTTTCVMFYRHFGSQSDLFNKLVYLLRIWFREWDLVF